MRNTIPQHLAIGTRVAFVVEPDEVNYVCADMGTIVGVVDDIESDAYKGQPEYVIRVDGERFTVQFPANRVSHLHTEPPYRVGELVTMEGYLDCVERIVQIRTRWDGTNPEFFYVLSNLTSGRDNPLEDFTSAELSRACTPSQLRMIEMIAEAGGAGTLNCLVEEISDFLTTPLPAAKRSLDNWHPLLCVRFVVYEAEHKRRTDRA